MVDGGGLAGGLVRYRLVIGIAGPQVLGIAVRVLPIQETPGNRQIIGRTHAHRINGISQRLGIADVALLLRMNHCVAKHPPGFAGNGNLFGFYHLIGGRNRGDSTLLAVQRRTQAASGVTAGDDPGLGIHISHALVRGGPGNIRCICRYRLGVRNGHLNLGALLHRVRTGNVKVLAGHAVNHRKGNSIIIFQLQQNVGNDFDCRGRQLHRVCGVAYNIFNGEAGVQQGRQHIAVHINAQILDENIGNLLSVNGAGIVQLIDVVDHLQQIVNKALGIRRHNNGHRTGVLKGYQAAVVHSGDHLALTEHGTALYRIHHAHMQPHRSGHSRQLAGGAFGHRGLNLGLVGNMRAVGQEVGVKLLVLLNGHRQGVVRQLVAVCVIQGHMHNGIDIVQIRAQGLNPLAGIRLKDLAQRRVLAHGFFNQCNDLVRVHGVHIDFVVKQSLFQCGTGNLAHQRYRLYLIVDPVLDHRALGGVKGLHQAVLVHIHQSGRLAVPLDITVVRHLAVNELVAQLQGVALGHHLMIGVALVVFVLDRIAV